MKPFNLKMKNMKNNTNSNYSNQERINELISRGVSDNRDTVHFNPVPTQSSSELLAEVEARLNSIKAEKAELDAEMKARIENRAKSNGEKAAADILGKIQDSINILIK
jgi:hypothetical protein